MVGLIVAAVVSVVGLVRFDQTLMIIALLSWPAILMLNAVVVAVMRWHSSNTQPGAAYVSAEEMIRLERLATGRRVRDRRFPRQ